MKYRKFGKLDWQVSALGLGTIVLRDEEEATRIIRHAIDRGVNYLDVSYFGISRENRRKYYYPLIGRALEDGYREKVKIAVTVPPYVLGSPEDFNRDLDGQLDLLGVDHADFAIIGWLDRREWPQLRGKGALALAESAVSDGRIGHLGFSFHDDYQTLRDILNDYDNWTFCQFNFSFMDVDHHPGVGGLRLAAENGLAVVVSEPLKNGRFNWNMPETVAAVWAKSSPPRSPAEWGLRWVWHHPEVSTVVDDVFSLEEIKEHISLSDNVLPGSLTVLEQLLVNEVRDAYRALRPIPCTACRGCMPCPQDIDVPRIFELYNDAVMYDSTPAPRARYHDEGHSIDRCNECRTCEKACGRNIAITDWLKKARQLLNK